MIVQTAAESSIATILAELLEYPQENLPRTLNRLNKALSSVHTQAHPYFLAFGEFVAKSPLSQWEESYVGAFDFNQDAALELGWHRFGEDYARGAFLVEMRGLLQEYGIEESGELPDHLTYALRLLNVLPKEKAAELVTQSILPSITKIVPVLSKKENPYRHLLLGLESLLQDQYTDGEKRNA